MRNLMILAGIGIMSAATWMDSAGQGFQDQDWTHRPHARDYGGLQGPMMRQGAGRYVRVGRHAILVVFPEQLIHGGPEFGPVSPDMFAGDLMAGDTEHPVAGPPPAPATHPHPVAHVPLRVEQGGAVIPQPAVPSAAPPDQREAAIAPPIPAVSPWLPRPPGTAGPGRPISGQPGPGMRGPGRPAPPRW
jgi:hypothetical protein